MSTLLAILLSVLPALADPPSTHGMLVFGADQVYVSHLPMFHPPHDYQLIAELVLPADAQKTYLNSRKEHPEETIYTLVPERLALPELVNHPHAFHADLYRGHFERGGTVIAAGLTVNLGRVLHWRKFVPGEPKPINAESLIFGTKAEAFLAHVIVAKPDFDQIVELGPNEAAEPGSAQIVREASYRFDQPYPDGANLLLRPLNSRNAAGPFAATVRRELYLETGDLSD